jgi:PIN domain nuclease of toxin-antitoxin system
VIVLDTHALIWFALEPERLSAAATRAIDSASERAISAITAQEVAYQAARKRIDLYSPVRIWLGDVLGALEAQALPVTAAIALRAGSLDPADLHGDPFDRLIYATAVEHDAQLVTADKRLCEADPPRVIW